MAKAEPASSKFPESNQRYEYLIQDDLEIAVIARAVCYDDGEKVSVDLINVNRDFRGKGLGSQLLVKIISQFKDKNLITSTWKYLVPWYEKYGFRVIGRNKGIFKLERNAVF
jgi:GNAT superfamily N-acetyltransferase